jgi:hypothetical protein
MSWTRSIFSRRRLHSELQEEIEGYISERAAFLMSQGMEPEEAERQARQTFGNAALTTERSVEIWQFHWLESLWSDLRFAFHQLRKSPGYTLTAVLTLVIGIGRERSDFHRHRRRHAALSADSKAGRAGERRLPRPKSLQFYGSTILASDDRTQKPPARRH